MRTTLIHLTKASCKGARKLLLPRILAWEQKGALTTLATRGRIALGLVALLLIGGSSAYAACMVYAVLATVQVGSEPLEVAVNPSTNRVYVTNILGNSVSVIDGTTNNVVATIPIGFPSGVAVNPSTNLIYVVSESFPTRGVFVIDGTNNSVVATIPVAGLPQPIAVNTTTNRIYVVDAVGRTSPQPDSTVYVIDGNTNSVVAPITVGKFSLDIGVNPITNRIYVANTDSSTISVIDGGTNMIVDTISLTDPVALGVNPATNRIYVSHFNPGGAVIAGYHTSLSVIDGATDAILDTVPAPETVTTGAVAVDATRNRVYLSSLFGTLSVFDGSSNALIATIPMEGLPIGVGVNPTINRIYVADADAHDISVIGLVMPQDAVKLLIDHVNRLVASGALTQNQGDALNVTLNLAKEKLTAGDIQGAMTALKLLDNAFINKVNALINSGNLTQAQGQALINEANSLITQLGC